MPSDKWDRNPRLKNQPFICHVRKFREEMGLTTRQLAKKCGLSNGSITFIEQGNDTRISTALALAKALNRCIEELWEPKSGKKPMKPTVSLRETTAGDVLREPRREQFLRSKDFAEARVLWQEARPL